MTNLWPIFAACIALAYCSQRRTEYLARFQKKQDYFFFVLLCLTAIVFVGLRTQYNDTGTYINTFLRQSKEGPIWESIDLKLGSNPGYAVVCALLARSGVSAHTYLLFFAAVTLSIYLWFIRKYADHFAFSVFLLFTTGVFTFTMAALKQCVAIAFCLLGVDRAINKKWVPFVLWVLLGSLFHPYALMFLITPILFFRPWSGKTYIMLAAFITAGFFLQPLMGTVINITTMLGEEYDASSFSGEGVNPFRLAVVSVPLVLSFLAKKEIWRENDRISDLFLNLTMLNAAIMFVALFGTANYFGRLANYFLIFQTLSLPHLLKHFERSSQKLLTGLALLCYLAYFYYANGINQPFDLNYAGISLWTYLKSIF